MSVVIYATSVSRSRLKTRLERVRRSIELVILKDKIVKIRKEQTCWGCAEKFEKGTKLRFVTAVDAGDFQNSYWCRVCDATFSDDPNEDGICLGECKEWDAWHDNARHLPRTF